MCEEIWRGLGRVLQGRQVQVYPRNLLGSFELSAMCLKFLVEEERL
jgi:hypothetical protein